MKDFLAATPLGRQNGIHPWNTFDGIQTGKLSESQFGFIVSLKGRAEGYNVGVPPSIISRLGKGEIRTKKMNIDGQPVIMVYSKSVEEYLS
jgi:hypothetical protein